MYVMNKDSESHTEADQDFYIGKASNNDITYNYGNKIMTLKL